jgi:hypothetical protein
MLLLFKTQLPKLQAFGLINTFSKVATTWQKKNYKKASRLKRDALFIKREVLIKTLSI